MVKQSAGAYRLPHRILIHGQARTVVGFWIDCQPYITLSINARELEIGKTLLYALSQSKTGVPDLTEFKGLMKPLIKAAGVRSYRRLLELAVYCGIGRTSESYTIDPTHNGGTRGDDKGFGYLPERRILIPFDAMPEQLGSALLRGFEACTSIYPES